MTLALVPITKALSKCPFDCGYSELNQYLRYYALKYDALSIGKTLAAVNESQELVGYLTISTAQIAAETLPEDLCSRLPRYPVPAFRIGKLAVDQRFKGTGAGRWILTQAFHKAVEISQSVGLYAILVDAIDDTAKGFYVKYGFVPFQDHPLTLFLPLATIKSAML